MEPHETPPGAAQIQAAGSSGSGEATPALPRWSDHDETALASLVDALYPELKQLAELRMSTERADHTLQPTALVNELYLQLAKSPSIAWENRQHFLVIASRAMRRLLVDHARARNCEKRGGQARLGGMEEHYPAPWDAPERVLAITELLDRLEIEEPRMARVIEMRYFGGLTFREIAGILSVDERTAKRDSRVAWAWISSQLRKPATYVGRSVGST